MTRPKIAFAALALTAAACALLSAAHADTIRDPVMGFSITFPGKPEPAEFEEDLPSWVRRLAGWEQHDDSGLFSITSVQSLPDDQTFTSPESALADLRPECLGDDAVVEERQLSIGGGAGVEVLTSRTTPDFTVLFTLGRVVVRKNKGYCVISSYYEDEDPSMTRAFVRSFKLD
jgi:hypothetical protein